MPYDGAEVSPDVTHRLRMMELRDFLAELPPEKFDIDEWICGTTACIGGWAERLFRFPSSASPQTIGAHIGLTGCQSNELFFEYPDEGEVTVSRAVAVLDHYLATGEIDWSVA